MERRDALILGGGPAGCAAALALAGKKRHVTLFEKRKLGGSCLHVGCIPTKFLQTVSLHKEEAPRWKNLFGLDVSSVLLDWETVSQKIRQTVELLEKGLHARLQQKGVEVIFQEARVLSSTELEAGGIRYRGEYLFLASGSRPKTLKDFPLSQDVVTSDELLARPKLPSSLLIVGGGVVGLEFASLYAGLGCRVRVVDSAPLLLPDLDDDVRRELLFALQRRKIAIECGVLKPERRDEEMVLVAVGRKADLDGAGAFTLELAVENDLVVVDGFQQTSRKGVYALGDLCSKLAFAHTAYEQARIAAAHALNENTEPFQETFVPRVIFTHPEIASVGLTEKQARDQGLQVDILKHPLAANAKAAIHGERRGFLKIVVESSSRKILGAHLIGPHAADLCGELCLWVRLGLSLSDIEKVLHPHPTLSEIFGFHG